MLVVSARREDAARAWLKDALLEFADAPTPASLVRYLSASRQLEEARRPHSRGRATRAAKREELATA